MIKPSPRAQDTAVHQQIKLPSSVALNALREGQAPAGRSVCVVCSKVSGSIELAIWVYYRL